MIATNKKFPLKIYDIFLSIYKEEYKNWWSPSNTYEIILGIILTQNCAWRNVQIAIKNLKKNKLLNPTAIMNIDEGTLEGLIKSAGYYKQKTKKIKIFTKFFYDNYNFSIRKMKNVSLDIMREQLLNLWGIGEESADSILCYALKKPSFVIDTYSKRLFYRLGATDENISYAEIKKYFTDRLELDVDMCDRYHAFIVIHCANICKKTPLCDKCVLRKRKVCSFNI